MKIIKSLTIALVLLLTTVSFAVAADQPPEPPMILKGDVEINGEQAPEDTQITAKLDGELIAKSTVEKSGQYELHLLKKDDYTGITFTVDGTESQPDSGIANELNNADPTKATYLDLSVTQSSNQNTENQVSGGFGSSSDSSTNDQDENTANTGGSGAETKGTTGDSSPSPDASAGTNDDGTETESTAVGLEATSSNVVLMVVGAIIIIGIIAAAGYKLRK